MENFFAQPIQIGSLKLRNRVFLAPLAGVSDVPFRRICQQLGAGLTYVEMLSARAINYSNKRTTYMRRRHPDEEILGVQITGPSPQETAEAVAQLDAEKFDTVDINMGCPVRKVVSANCGSAILKDPEYMSQLVAAVRERTAKPLSVKVRLGFDQVNISETIPQAVQQNVDMFIIHGRTAHEKYSIPVHFDGIQKGIEAGKAVASRDVVTVGNGDIFDFASAQQMRRQTHCDAVMVSRGALGNPWIFREILSGEPAHPSAEEWLEVVLRHLQYHEEFYGDNKFAAVRTRKFLSWYAKGFPNWKALRPKIQHLESIAAARQMFIDYAATFPKDMVRFQGKHHLQQGYDPKYEMDRQHDRGVGDEGMSEA